jgi:hypothetical protein
MSSEQRANVLIAVNAHCQAAKGRKMNELMAVEKIAQWHNEREVRILAETTGRYSFPRQMVV